MSQESVVEWRVAQMMQSADSTALRRPSARLDAEYVASIQVARAGTPIDTYLVPSPRATRPNLG